MIKESHILRESWQVDRAATSVAAAVVVIAVFDDLTVAIFAGVILSLLLFTFEAVSKIKAVRIQRREDDRFEFADVPDQLPSNEVTTIELLGTIFFASVYSYDELLPNFKEAKNAVMILDMRGRQTVFETSVEFAEKYLSKLHASGNQFMLCNVSETILKQIKATEVYDLIGEDNIFLSNPIIGVSLEEAWQAAEQWIAERQELESA